jgi:hypothetical protein
MEAGSGTRVGTSRRPYSHAFLIILEFPYLVCGKLLALPDTIYHQASNPAVLVVLGLQLNAILKNYGATSSSEAWNDPRSMIQDLLPNIFRS